MCGIAGFCNRPGDWRQDIESMTKRLRHRGPDAGGSWASKDHSVVLGHRRLAILDLSQQGSQPMVSHSGRYVIAFNGEIYNYTQLKEKLDLEKGPAAWRGGSDTEVLLEALEAYGVREGVAMCKGMFAFALYDQKEKALWLCRDRIGEKPLYYGFVGGSFVFASEIGAIAALPGFQNPVDKNVLGLYLENGYIPAPYSVYEGIYKLKPGRMLYTKAPFLEFEESVWWSVEQAALAGQESPFRGTRQEAAEELERLLRASIVGQMVADVPLGAFLSGGIDSSAVVALMQAQSREPVRTFTIGMAEEEFNEAAVAKEIALHLGTKHTELYISAKEAQETIPKLPAIFGEPFADSSQIPTYLVSAMTRRQVTVALSGDGGDELFCGYNTYTSLDAGWERIRRIPGGLRRVAAALLGGPLAAGSAARSRANATRALLLSAKTPEQLYRLSNLSEPFLRRLVISENVGGVGIGKGAACIFDTYPSGFLLGVKNNLMLLDLLMYHPDDILVKVDRAAMAVSLETRVPMLDKDVVEFALSLPLSYKWQGGVGKQVLRDVLYRYVPRELMERPKKGFAIPLERWMKEPKLRDWMTDLLAPDKIRREGFFCPETVEKLVREYIKQGIWRRQLWYLAQFEAWLEMAAA